MVWVRKGPKGINAARGHETKRASRKSPFEGQSCFCVFFALGTSGWSGDTQWLTSNDAFFGARKGGLEICPNGTK